MTIDFGFVAKGTAGSDYGDYSGFPIASQIATTALKIGSAATDSESIPTTNAAATGDDTTGTDDENLTMPTFTVGTTTALSVPVTATLSSLSGTAARAIVFVDWNGDGDVLDANETLAVQTVANGTASLTFNLTPPAGTTAGTKYLRIRVAETTVTPAFSGTSTLKGEVEDYAITVNTAANLSVGNLVWNDANNNGLKDAGEVGVGGATVQLFSTTNAIIGDGDDVQVGSNFTTAVSGAYLFSSLPAGNYYVKVTPPAGFPVPGGTPATTDNNVDNNNDGSQSGAPGTALFSPIINLALGAESIADGDTDPNTNFTVDFGLFSGFTVGDLVFNDANNNGTKDVGESGISGLTVELLNSAGASFSPAVTTTTNASGNYGFLVYSPGTYKMKVTPNGTYPLASSSVGTDNATDNNNDGTQSTQGTPSTSFAFTLSAGAEPGVSGGVTNVETTIDFGFRACPTITPAALAAATVGTAYAGSVAATGGTGSYTYAVTSGALPAWASLNTSSGAVTGLPNNTVAATFTITATDSVGCQGARAYTFAAACPVVSVTPVTLPAGVVGSAYSQTLSGSGGTSPYTFSISAGALPAGLSLNTTSGAITGTPTTANGTGTSVTFVATDTYGCVGSRAITVQICPVITISPATLPNGYAGMPYVQNITTSGGSGSTALAIASGSLPTGLSFNTATGVISGTPTGSGTFSFGIRATDSSGCVVVNNYSVSTSISLDFGDYTGFAAAAQLASPDIRIGTNATDAEAANPTTGAATADDTTGSDDEDLTIPSVSPGIVSTFSFPVTLSGTATTGRLMMWADWNGDNLVTGTNEIVTSSAISLVAGTNNVVVTLSPPVSTSVGTKYLRIIATEGSTAPSFNVLSTNRGEVEDYPITVVSHTGCDFGDLADTGAGTGAGNYKTLNSDSGAGAAVISGLSLGTQIDAEPDGQPNSTATGDGADEDGLTVPTFVVGAGTSIVVRATNTMSPAAPAYLSLWIDWNNNGSFEDGGDKVASNVLVAAGTNNAAFTVNFTVPAAASVGAQIGVRARLSTESGMLSYGLSQGGEVEDYLSAPVLAGVTLGNFVWGDNDNNGVYNSGTEAGLTGVTVTALGFGADGIQGTGDDTTTTTTTTAGAYSFVLSPGKYIVQVTPPATRPLASGIVNTSDDGVDSDNNGLQTGGVMSVVSSPVITLTAGGEPGSTGATNTENTIDFGLRACPTLTSSVSGSWNATHYTAFSQTLTAAGGVAPYSWSITGALPGGLTFNNAATSTTATITGTPDGSTAPGSYPITIGITDALGCVASVNYTVVLGCPTIASSPATLPAGTQDAAYDQVLTASGGSAPYTWSVTGTLPAGLGTTTPTSSTFRLSGTPTTVESRTVTIRATDKWGCFKDTSYTIAIGCPPIEISPASPLAAITQYQAMTSVTFSATGGRTPYTWSIDSATPLPAGLSLAAATGVLSGTPTAAPGTYNFNVKLTDNSGCPGSKAYAITVACPAVTIGNAATLASGTTSAAYSVTLTATTAGTGVPAQTYTWSSSGALPPGLTLNASTGVLSGTPTTAGTYNFTATATNQQSCAGSKAFSLTVNCATIALSTASPLPGGTQYGSYSQSLAATGGTSTYTFTLASGTLPGGVTLSTAGLLSSASITAAPGTYNFTVQAKDGNNCTGTKAYALTIACPTIVISPASPLTAVSQYSAITPITFSASGGTAAYTWSIDAATPLPTGLSFNTGTATLSGTPTAAPGAYSFNVKVSDANGCLGSKSYALTINCNTVTIAPASLPDGTVGTAYSQTPTATLSGTGVPAQTWTWSITSGALPAGLSLNTSTGQISSSRTRYHPPPSDESASPRSQQITSSSAPCP